MKGQDFLPNSFLQNSKIGNNAICSYKQKKFIKFNNYSFKKEYTKFTKTFFEESKFDKNELKEFNDSILSLN